MQRILKGFAQKSGEIGLGEIITAKHKSKIKNIGIIQYGKMAKLAK